MQNENEFSSPDFYVSAFLLAKGYKLTRTQSDGSGRVFFVFADDEDRKDLLRAFLYGKAQVECQAFINAIKSLKQVIHSRD